MIREKSVTMEVGDKNEKLNLKQERMESDEEEVEISIHSEKSVEMSKRDSTGKCHKSKYDLNTKEYGFFLETAVFYNIRRFQHRVQGNRPY